MTDEKKDGGLAPVQPEIDDPLEVLDLLKRAILRQDVDKGQVGQALKQVLHHYEMQNRVFLIAAANAELPRILRLLSFLNTCEQEMFQPERLEDASMKELTRLYALAQSTLLTGLDSVKTVADMRLEMQAGGGKGPEAMFRGDEELNVLSETPGLDAHGRDRVRKLVGGLMDVIKEDDSVVKSEDEPDPTDTED